MSIEQEEGVESLHDWGGGHLLIKPDGTIDIQCQGDDYWNGSLTIEQAQELLRELLAHPRINTPNGQAPLNNEEIRWLTVWETDPEVEAFKVGWAWFRSAAQSSPDWPAVPLASYFNLYPESQNERMAWQRGATACELVYRLMLRAATPHQSEGT
jgi:hypothetical protein